MLTQERLKKLYSYDPDTGLFIRLISRGGKKVGTVAGYRRPDGYIRIKIDGNLYLSHRLVFLYITGKFPENQVDHINGTRDDNKWYNLRKATSTENNRNVSIASNNTSGTTGVSWHKDSSKWEASICNEGKLKYLGRFIELEEAIRVRKQAEVTYGYHQNHGLTRPQQ